LKGQGPEYNGPWGEKKKLNSNLKKGPERHRTGRGKRVTNKKKMPSQ